MRTVVAPSRLHFGLIRRSPDAAGVNYGGCGVMLSSPRTIVRAEPADDWSATGPNAERALEFAKRACALPHRLIVEECPPVHAGFGSGTSLALAVGRAVAPGRTVDDIALSLGRGQRSGVGLHGFRLGGFVADGGKRAGELPGLIERIDVPSEWRFAVLLPDEATPWHGSREREAFSNDAVQPDDERRSERLNELMVGELVPALHAADFDRFSRALTDYNRTSGELFAAEQGGPYAGGEVARLLAELQSFGVLGIGQSSWGPGVFAAFRCTAEAEEMLKRFDAVRSWLAAASNEGAIERVD